MDPKIAQHNPQSGAVAPATPPVNSAQTQQPPTPATPEQAPITPPSTPPATTPASDASSFATPSTTSQAVPTPPTASQPSSTDKPKAKPFKKILLLLLVLIVLLGLAGGGYYILSQKQATPKKMTVIPTPTTQPTPTPDPTASWQTYTSEKYKYSVKYPTNLKVTEDNKLYHFVTFTASTAASLPTFVTSVVPDTFVVRNLSAYNFMSSDWYDQLNTASADATITKAGVTFTKLPNTDAGIDSVLVDIKATGSLQRRYYMKNGGYIYMVSMYYQKPEELDNFHLFMSNFKFLK